MHGDDSGKIWPEVWALQKVEEDVLIFFMHESIKFAEIDENMYKEHFSIFIDDSKMDNKVSSGGFPFFLNFATDKKLFDNYVLYQLK